MQVWAMVNEANIGRIYPGMPVQFTVDAHPKDTFRGKVIQVRMNAQMTSNVVNYMVIIEADNPEGKLFPYMTASVSFEEPKRTNVLMVPNAALRWKPKSADDSQTIDDAAGEKHTPWVLGKEGPPEPLAVHAGPTDGTSDRSLRRTRAGRDASDRRTSQRQSAADDEPGGDGKPNMPFMPKFPKKGPPKGPGGPPPG